MTSTDVVDELFAPAAAHGTSLALVVMREGEVVVERYGRIPETVFGPASDVSAETPLISWSMAKSITHALVGILVGDGRLRLDAPAPVASWRGTDKEAITLQHLLEMRPGLEFNEDYVDQRISNCLEMLFGEGQQDMAAYAAGLPLAHPPGSVWNYSSGTTNIVARIAGDAVGGGEAGMRDFLIERLFAPCAMTSATAQFDPAGTFVGSSYVHATAADFARFGELYRNDGMVDGRRVLPEGWVRHATTFTARDDGHGADYGRHWWLWRDRPVFAAHGYEGQYTIVAPEHGLVIVHLGKSPTERRPPLLDALTALLDQFAP